MTQETLVVKVGTEVLLDKQRQLDPSAFRRIGDQIVRLAAQGTQVALVSSGAIAAGMGRMGLTERPDWHTQMARLQMLACIGWPDIVQQWQAGMGSRPVGSMLLTQVGLAYAGERDNALRVVGDMFTTGVTPLINENDTVATQEIGFGDNDVLAAVVAKHLHSSGLFGAVRLVLLTSVDGVYADPHDPTTLVRQLDPVRDARRIAIGERSAGGTGGMASKIMAASVAAVPTYIANGCHEDAIAA